MTVSAAMDSYDVIIVGAGTNGLGAAYHATARGLKTLLIDQYDIPNSVNSSKGIERIFRIMYAQPSQIRITESAYALWHAIQAAYGTEILAPEELLFFGHSDAPPTPEGNLQQAAEAMSRMGIPYVTLDSPAQIAARFPVLNPATMPSTYIGLVQRQGASINVQASHQAMLALANATGHLTMMSQTKVTQISPDGTGYLVSTLAGSVSQDFFAEHLIVCAGVWANDALQGLGLRQSPDWKIWQMTYAYWKVQGGAHMPLWYEFGNTPTNPDGLFYGFPKLDFAPDGLVKMSADYTNTILEDPSGITSTPDPRILSDLVDHLGRLFVPGVIDVPNHQNAGTCLYSMSPDTNLVIGKIPDLGGSAGSAFQNASMCIMASGRGFKYAPIFGRVLVELAVDGESTYTPDLEEFDSFRGGLFVPATT